MKGSKHIKYISAIGDLLILNGFFNYAFCAYRNFDSRCFETLNIVFFIFINIAWLISANVFKTYSVGRQVYIRVILLSYIKSAVFFFFLFLLFFQVFTFNYFQRDEIKILFIVFFASLAVWKLFFNSIITIIRKSGFNQRNVVIVGYNNKAFELRDYFNDNPWTGYHFKGFFTQKESTKTEIAGTVNDLEKFTIQNNIDEIYILIGAIHKSVHNVISSIISKHPVKIRLVQDLSDFSYMNIKLVSYESVPVIQIQQGPLNFWYNRIIKRFLDITISMLVIVFVLSWIIPVLFIINLFTDKTSLFFVQPRSGLNNRNFNCIKFRTMKINGQADLVQATKNDERITDVGKILRKTSIDELPQFFNVLTGKMSVVGPRPHMIKHTDKYKSLVDKFMIRHTIKPGITGYAQVKGHRGEIRKIKDMKDRIKLDISYIENWSLWFDMKIILLTIGKLLIGDKKAY